MKSSAILHLEMWGSTRKIVVLYAQLFKTQTLIRSSNKSLMLNSLESIWWANFIILIGVKLILTHPIEHNEMMNTIDLTCWMTEMYILSTKLSIYQQSHHHPLHTNIFFYLLLSETIKLIEKPADHLGDDRIDDL